MANETALDRTEIIEDSPIEQVITEDFIARFEKQAQLYQDRYLPICLKLTNEADWINHGTDSSPKYSLQSSGAEKVCNPLGIVWERPAVIKHEREDDRGKYYEYEVEGIVHSRVLRRYGWFTGNCSSRDQFFNARGHFDEGDIRKAAFSNWIVNAVTRLAGIRNPTPNMLTKAGLKSESIGRITYGGGRTPEESEDRITGPQVKRLWALMNNAKVPEARVRDHIKLFLKIDGFNEIKKKDYNPLCAWVEAGAPDHPPKEEDRERQGSLPGNQPTTT